MTLQFRNIDKSYGRVAALRDVCLTMESGIYALLGPNGSGKSTLMNILTDNLAADRGQILYSENGTDFMPVLKMGVRFREKLGFMPQYPGFYPDFTVEELMGYVASLKGLKRKEAGEQIREILTRVELYDVRKHRVKTLSGGMKQRLGLAQAVLGDPEILILDEPTAGLDPRQRISVRNYISEIAFDKIVIIATHIVSDIEAISKSVIFLKNGTVTDNASPAVLLRGMEGKVWSVSLPADGVRGMKERYRVVNIGREEGSDRAVLRILADECPCAGAAPASPTLEDCYFDRFGGMEGEAAEHGEKIPPENEDAGR